MTHDDGSSDAECVNFVVNSKSAKVDLFLAFRNLLGILSCVKAAHRCAHTSTPREVQKGPPPPPLNSSNAQKKKIQVIAGNSQIGKRPLSPTAYRLRCRPRRLRVHDHNCSLFPIYTVGARSKTHVGHCHFCKHRFFMPFSDLEPERETAQNLFGCEGFHG
ncbi:hypothetical protein EVAR_81070_1 [Eumeta japonica]|uniref:Uncharacterized protein n=1 Tax=Eumeta variegata TaxID=151549 RepID=A0A4C1T5K6_EUMVA|nr:hypothetical protein EVAR_81070_1 [Eumeta japonica]